jgi:O-acetyl-ADP-ribose deacetylase (regulator of RNase III)
VICTNDSLRGQADEMGIRTIAVPQIGTGYGGLSWKKVRAIIEQLFVNWSRTLYIYGEYVPGR